MSVTPKATQLFEVKPGSDVKSATFIFGNEDHTLGNALRHVLSQNASVDFVGYSVPHPYEPKMNIRLQALGENSAISTLKKSLVDVQEAANVLDDCFIKAVQDYIISTQG